MAETGPDSDRSPTAARLCLRSNLSLLRHFQCIVHLDAKIPYSALKLGMPEEQLHSTEVLRATIDGPARRRIAVWTTST
jgi:hypothetical protein